MSHFIGFFLRNITLSLLVLGFIAALLSLSTKKTITKAVMIEAIFSYYLLFSVGISYFYNFIMHCFFGEFTAAFIGWAQSPFQFEVGTASLGIAIAGFISFRSNLSFRAATLIVPIVFCLGAAGGHIYQMILNNNFAPGNAGVVLWSDIMLPVISLTLLWLSNQSKSE